jgi:protein-L-isoaspartate(D-aspartate) O-methyltransferase
MADSSAHDIEREIMVDNQVRPNKVNDRRVIAAMRTLPREAFAPAGVNAYADTDIDLGGGRFLLSPMVTARLAQFALAGDPGNALVVGAGAGYLAAVLSAAGLHVVALEEESRLDTGALAQYAPQVEGVRGPLTAGWGAIGPYDVIVIEGAVPEIPENFAAQLVPGGRLIAILADGPEPGGIGRVVVGEAAGAGYALVRVLDCTARILPQFQHAPVFSF